jgi:hypothetical protein
MIYPETKDVDIRPKGFGRSVRREPRTVDQEVFMSGSVANLRLEVLLKRQAALKSAIDVETVREQKRRDKENTRLHLIVGEALVRDSEGSPEFKSMLIRVLEGADLGDSERAFLARKGWL